ncbi:MAG TPA: DUF3850 domain-containing protein [Nitrospiraceae bacterium]
MHLANPNPTRFPSKHRVKSHPDSFREVWEGAKGHEIRINDRRYKVADSVRLNEYDPETGNYSGRSIDVIIINLRFAEGEGFPVSSGLKPGFVVFDFLIVTKYTRPGGSNPESAELFNPEGA